MESILQSPIFPMVLMFGVLYLFFLRPKQKEMQKTEEMRKNLKKGDRVVTMGGAFGVVHEIRDAESIVVLKMGGDVRIEFEKSAVQRLIVDEKTDKSDKAKA